MLTLNYNGKRGEGLQVQGSNSRSHANYEWTLGRQGPGRPKMKNYNSNSSVND